MEARLLVKRTVMVTAIVTEGLKADLRAGTETHIANLKTAVEEIEGQGRRLLLQSKEPVTVAQFQAALRQQRDQFAAAKKEQVEKLAEIDAMAEGDRIPYMQLESFDFILPGDNLLDKLNCEVTIKDGVVLSVIDGKQRETTTKEASNADSE